MSVPQRVIVAHLGLASYDATYSLQRFVFEAKVAARKAHRLSQRTEKFVDPYPDVVFTVEISDSIYTMGKRDTSSGFLDEAIARAPRVEPKAVKYSSVTECLEALQRPASAVPQVRRIERGGGLTWHGPGQVVMYPIVALRDAFLRQSPETCKCSALHWWVTSLEDAMMDVISETSARLPATTPNLPTSFRHQSGVWVANDKIGFVGMHQSEYVALHGCSFNVDCDLKVFSPVVMCEMPDKKPTNLATVFKPYVGATKADQGGWLPELEGDDRTFRVPTVEEVSRMMSQSLVSKLKGVHHDSLLEYHYYSVESAIDAVLEAFKA